MSFFYVNMMRVCLCIFC